MKGSKSFLALLTVAITLLALCTLDGMALAQNETDSSFNKKELDGPNITENILPIQALDSNPSRETAEFSTFTSQENKLTRSDYFSGAFILSIDYEGKRLIKENQSTGERTVLFQGDVSHVQKTNHFWYFINENRILRFDDTTTKIDIVYSATHSITQLDATDEILYFVADVSLYRLSPTGTDLQFLQSCENVELIRGVSSTTVIWCETNPDAALQGIREEPEEDNISGASYYLYDALKNVTTELSYYEYREYYSLTSAVVSPSKAAGDGYIFGTKVPLSNYPALTKYFNKTATYPGTDNPDIAGTSACNHPNGSGIYCRTFHGCSQCWGFANYVFFKIFNVNRSGLYIDVNVNYLYKPSDLKAKLQSLTPGVSIRIDDSLTANGRHSFILVSADANTFTVYEANFGGDCRVYLNTYSYSSPGFKWLLFYYHPCATGNHLYSTLGSSNSTQHKLFCLFCGHEKWFTHNWYYSNRGASGHVPTCAGCSYTKPLESHTLSDGACTKCSYKT